MTCTHSVGECKILNNDNDVKIGFDKNNDDDDDGDKNDHALSTNVECRIIMDIKPTTTTNNRNIKSTNKSKIIKRNKTTMAIVDDNSPTTNSSNHHQIQSSFCNTCETCQDGVCTRRKKRLNFH